jgi:hypothetical protein
MRAIQLADRRLMILSTRFTIPMMKRYVLWWSCLVSFKGSGRLSGQRPKQSMIKQPWYFWPEVLRGKNCKRLLTIRWYFCYSTSDSKSIT